MYREICVTVPLNSDSLSRLYERPTTYSRRRVWTSARHCQPAGRAGRQKDGRVVQVRPPCSGLRCTSTQTCILGYMASLLIISSRLPGYSSAAPDAHHPEYARHFLRRRVAQVRLPRGWLHVGPACSPISSGWVCFVTHIS